MKKSHLYLFFFLIILNVNCLGQTRDIDYNYILNHYLSNENNPNYITKDLTSSSFPKSSEITSSLQFVSFITKNDNKNRGVAIVYKEKKSNNELIKMLVLCFPEKNSESSINNKSVLALNSINDTFILKYILSGFIKTGVNY